MKYLSIDLETTGLDPSYCQVLEIGAIVDDTNWPDVLNNTPKHRSFGGRPFFHTYVVHERIVGTAYALMMNAGIIEKIAKQKDHKSFTFLTPKEAMAALLNFIAEHFPQKDYKKVTVAGKNFASFDRNFLSQMPHADLVLNRFHHRVFDPAGMYFEPGDTELPNLEKCLKRAGIGGEVTHNACEDAYKVVQVIRRAAETAAACGCRVGVPTRQGLP
jgi:oligoribonuclease (3'-5' exoribonuclease)